MIVSFSSCRVATRNRHSDAPMEMKHGVASAGDVDVAVVLRPVGCANAGLPSAVERSLARARLASCCWKVRARKDAAPWRRERFAGL